LMNKGKRVPKVRDGLLSPLTPNSELFLKRIKFKNPASKNILFH
jgi:hypothetical protein